MPKVRNSGLSDAKGALQTPGLIKLFYGYFNYAIVA